MSWPSPAPRPRTGPARSRRRPRRARRVPRHILGGLCGLDALQIREDALHVRACRKPNSVRIIRDFCFSVASVAVHVVRISRRDDLRRGGAFYSQWQVLLCARAPDVYHAVGDLPASLGARRQGRQTQGQISQGECSLHTNYRRPYASGFGHSVIRHASTRRSLLVGAGHTRKAL